MKIYPKIPQITKYVIKESLFQLFLVLYIFKMTSYIT